MSAPLLINEFSGNATTNTSNSNVAFYLSKWEHNLMAILVALIAVMGIVGNSMIITAVAFSRKLQTSTNAFVTSLSVADLLTSSFMFFYIGLLGQYEWPVPNAEWMCAVTGFVIFNCLGASVYNLAVISMNRLILITKPNAYQRIFTSWKLGLLVALPWFIPCSIITILVVIGIGAFGYDKSDLSCSDLDLHKKGHSFRSALALIGLPVPYITIVISYVWIYVYLKKHFRKQKAKLAVSMNIRNETIQISDQDTETSTGQMVTSEESIVSKSCHSNDEPSSISETPFKTSTEEATKPGSHTTVKTSVAPSIRKRKKISRQQTEITKNLFIVICAFSACFIPYFVLSPLLGSSHVIYYIRILPLANSAINFVIYAHKHPDFKVVLGCLMKRSYADIPQPSRLLKFLLAKKT